MMTTATTPLSGARSATKHDARTPARSASTNGGGLRRFLALCRGELSILLRNKAGTFYAVALAPIMVLAFANLPQTETIAESMGPGGLTTHLVAMLAVFGLLMAVYYNLTTAVVARREKLVLKRLVAGETRPREILAAVATPNVAIFLVQTLAVLVIGIVAFGAPAFTNPVLIVLALGLGIVFAVALSYFTGAKTNTVEAAQMTTMPGMMLGMMLSGIILPMAMLPDTVVRVLELLPFYPLVQLLQLGMSGSTGTETASGFLDAFVVGAQPLGVLAAWTVLAVFLARRAMVWEPRR